MKLNLNKDDYIFVKSFEKIYDVLQISDIYKNEGNKSIYKVHTLRNKKEAWCIEEDLILGKVEMFGNRCNSIMELINK